MMHIFKNISLALATLACLMAFQPKASAGSDIWPFKNRKRVQAYQGSSVKRHPIEDFFEDESKGEKGFIGVHLMDDYVYFELSEDILGRDLLLGSTVKSISDMGSGLVGEKDELIHFTFTRSGEKVQMRSVNTSFLASEKNIQPALSKSSIGAIMENFDIECWSEDSTSFVIDMTDIFLSDDDERLSPFSYSSLYSDYEISESFNRSASFIRDVKAFRDNVSVTSMMSYQYSVKTEDGQTIVKPSALSAEVTRSILLLPEKIYHPRMADPRIGFFHTERTQVSSLVSSSKTINLVRRWDLAPKDTAAYKAGELVEPVKPIVFYIDSDFPEWWRPYIKQAVEMWNEPFERIGFRNAVIAKNFPSKEEDPEFDPDNIKYSCIRYAPVGVRNAMGPSWTDPRSGEIINASVFIFHDIIKLLQEWLIVQTGQADPRVRTADIPKEILGDAICYVVRHEVGHTLGLMHNMGASATVPVDSLRSPSYTQKYGTAPSIMDYARFNYVAQPGDFEKGVRLTPTAFGEYDYWAIQWGYTPLFEDDFEKESKITRDWISAQIAKSPVYRYGKQQRGAKFYDPRNQSEDLSDDVVKASGLGISNLKYVMDNFMQWITDEDDPDMELRKAILKAITDQYQRYVGHLAMTVGGLYTNEVLSTDGIPRFEGVPRQKQTDALKALMDMAMDTDWLDRRDILSRLGEAGSPSTSLSAYIWERMMYTPFYASVSDGVGSRQFSAEQCLDMIFDYTWKSTSSSKALSDKERILQELFVDTLMDVGDFETPPGTKAGGYGFSSEVGGFEKSLEPDFSISEITQATIYSYLTRARDLMKAKKASAGALDKAHYELLIGKINYSIK